MREKSVLRLAVLTVVAASLSVASAWADVEKVRGLVNTLGGGDALSIAKAAKEFSDLDIGRVADAVLEDEGILRSLRGLAEDAEHPAAKKAAEGALRRVAPELGDRLPDALGDKDKVGRVIGALGGLGSYGEGAGSKLVDVVADTSLDSGLRSQAIGALGDIGSRGDDGMVEKALRSASHDPDEKVAGAAREALQRLH